MDICGKEGCLDLVVRSLWGRTVRFGVLWSSPRSFVVGHGGTLQTFHTSFEVWRLVGRILSGEQAMRYKLERKHRWAKVQLSSGQNGAGVAAEKTEVCDEDCSHSLASNPPRTKAASGHVRRSTGCFWEWVLRRVTVASAIE